MEMKIFGNAGKVPFRLYSIKGLELRRESRWVTWKGYGGPPNAISSGLTLRTELVSSQDVKF